MTISARVYAWCLCLCLFHQCEPGFTLHEEDTTDAKTSRTTQTQNIQVSEEEENYESE